MVLRLPIDVGALPIVMLGLGIATQRAITEVAGIAADLRWPNDVLIEAGGIARKCAGILAQTEGSAIVAGIGINVNHTNFPSDLEAAATSLRMAGRMGVSREDLLVALIEEVDGCCRILTMQGADTILRMFARASSYVQGRRVRVEREGTAIEGVTCGLDPSGFLVVREDNGKETTVLAGGVRPA
jgi:BirA family biotin operon repressor/biotin-[acetyl-CoA-carboxylase] ligase